MCKLSIIIPVYATEKFLPRCLESILNQSFQNYEIIIVNDHSPGNCKKIVLKYRDNRIRYIEFSDNLGLHQARVQGAAIARGEYLMHLDSDDFLLHNSVLSDLMPYLDGVDILAYQFRLVHENGSTTPGYLKDDIFEGALITRDDAYFELFYGGLPDSVALKVIKKTLWDKCADFFLDTHLVNQEDFFTTVHLLYYAENIRTLPLEGYGYYCRSDSSSRNFCFSKAEQLIKTIIDFGTAHNGAAAFFKAKSLYDRYESALYRHHLPFYKNILLQVSSLPSDEFARCLPYVQESFPFHRHQLEIQHKLHQKASVLPDCPLSLIVRLGSELHDAAGLRELMENFSECEVIVIDDGGKNKRPAGEKYIRYLSLEPALGETWSFLAGIAEARGCFICFSDGLKLFNRSLLKSALHSSQNSVDLWYIGTLPQSQQEFLGYIPQWQKNISPYFQQAVAREIFIPPMENYLFSYQTALVAAQHVVSPVLRKTGLWLFFLLVLWQVKEIRTIEGFSYTFDGCMQEILQKKRLSPQKADAFLEEIFEALRKLSDFLNTQNCFNIFTPLLSQHKKNIYSPEHLRMMMRNIYQYLLDEEMKNPGKAWKDYKILYYSRLNPENISQVLSGDQTVKDAVFLLINRVGKRSPFLAKFLLYLLRNVSWFRSVFNKILNLKG